MYKNDFILIPRIGKDAPQRDTIEWGIPQQVSVALTLLDKFGYTVIAKVKVKKQHWWNRSWKTFITHAPTPDVAFRKGLEFLESYGYTIEYDADQFEEMIGIPIQS